MKTTRKAFDLVVLGGGVIGLSAALHVLARRPQWRVAVLEGVGGAGVASRAAAGMLLPFAEFHADGPLFRLCVASLHEYPRFLDAFAPVAAGGPDFVPCGALLPVEGEDGGRSRASAALAEEFAALEEWAPAQVREREPFLAPRSFLRVPGAVVDPRRLLGSLRMHAEACGVALLPGVPLGVDPAVGGGFRIRCGGAPATELHGERLLLATGAWSAEVGALLGLSVPVVPVKGQVARVAVPDGTLGIVVHSHGIYLAPRPGAGVLFGATMEWKGFDAGVEDATVAGLQAAAAEFAPGIAGLPVAERWAGFRPHFADGLPALGPSSRVPGLFIATGHFRNGILLTPITGRLLAGAMLGEALPPEFLPARLGL